MSAWETSSCATTSSAAAAADAPMGQGGGVGRRVPGVRRGRRLRRRAHRSVPARGRPAGRVAVPDRVADSTSPTPRARRRGPGRSGASRTTTSTWAAGAPRGGAGTSGSPSIDRGRSPARGSARLHGTLACDFPIAQTQVRRFGLAVTGRILDGGMALTLAQASIDPTNGHDFGGFGAFLPFRTLLATQDDAVHVTHRSSPRRRAGPRDLLRGRRRSTFTPCSG